MRHHLFVNGAPGNLCPEFGLDFHTWGCLTLDLWSHTLEAGLLGVCVSTLVWDVTRQTKLSDSNAGACLATVLNGVCRFFCASVQLTTMESVSPSRQGVQQAVVAGFSAKQATVKSVCPSD